MADTALRDPRADRYLQDSVLIESLDRVDDDLDILDTPQAHEAYTNGACWYLAWWMHQLTGLTIATIGGYDSEILDSLDDPGEWDGYRWTHVGVWVGEEFLDITGLLDPDDAMETYCEEEGEEHGIYDISSAEEFTRVVFDPTQMSDHAAQLTQYVAEQLLARHGIATR